MPKQLTSNDFNTIIQIVTASHGATIEDILAKLKPSMPRRTLQRRLSALVATHQLSMIGQGRAVSYTVPNKNMFYSYAPETQSIPLMVREAGELYIPISSAGEEIRKLVSQPIYQRHPKPLAEPTTTSRFAEGTERRIGVYALVHDDLSTVPTNKAAVGVGLSKGFIGYRREFLDAYEPNITQYLRPEDRQRLYQLGVSEEKRPSGSHARQVLSRLLIDLSWNSSRLEGNTYSILETECLLQQGKIAEGKDIVETQMILNHKYAIEFLVESIDEIGFNRYTILNLHALLADGLLHTEKVGVLRAIHVGIGKSVYHPLPPSPILHECFDQILAIADAIDDPFEQSFFMMVHLPYLQPFEDVNKRVSRLAANIPLIRHNLSPLSFVDMPEQSYLDGLLGVYELNRIELLRDMFVWAYQRSARHYPVVCQSVGEPDPLMVRYRQLIKETVAAVVRERCDKKTADLFIKQEANRVLIREDRPRFVEITEKELMALHEGSIARYKIRPSEFQAWQE